MTQPKRAESAPNQPARAPVSDPVAATKPICSLPLVGPTTFEDAVFYTTVGVVALAEFVSWPTATLIAGSHALHQRTRNVIRTGSVAEAREGLIEALDDIA